MNKQQAQKMIEELMSEVDEHNVITQFWMDKVQGYTQTIFGDHSQSIALPMFGTYYWDRPYHAWDQNKKELVVEKLKQMFSTYLAMINSGAFLKQNFLSRFSTPEIIITIVVTVLGLGVTLGSGLYNLGYLFGGQGGECKVFYFEKENQKLKDDLAETNRKLLEYKSNTQKTVTQIINTK
ncbi:MAG TPA: hypothetical protein VEB40_11210 [Flavipsychrobacter sp.]|nr:hypothetical protein [Flavipsychrobacter sp.]